MVYAWACTRSTGLVYLRTKEFQHGKISCIQYPCSFNTKTIHRGFHAKFCRLGLRLSLNDVPSKKKFQLFSSKETAEHFRLSQNFFLPNRLKEKYLNDPFNNFRKGFRTESLIMIACLFEYCIAIHLLFPFFFNLVSWSDGNKVKITLLSFIASDQKCKSHICLILWVTE